MSRDSFEPPYAFEREESRAASYAKEAPDVRWIGGTAYDADDVPDRAELEDET